ncbi:hypothetical protein CLAFUW4_12830 [Fulvia fulva]|uniref:Uncharacterized protein n=1 Tax=Passalora fulva TaxID=5499 RepID=A0A9Q8PJ65_PASFU|nr:uncharacterized protein CLAFUR5_12696 [Fulvia fulva]KAK4612345.1 hypothetical protein CLAFUR4_12834 [Fulvia fulva]KAK4612554.1 hypothetical protein CLAFUR0_12840 [Fulvia fulva]UJO23443.1 hypothetical protein CLAFUR5_12696 [Fulvia fulva]WPV21674.1 hypothetical protein CLAFUW4_12830 [Fulvia fulva]WPV36391.1 hypothetical protein CLAFUW7_12838 [Fulvia fulva]
MEQAERSPSSPSAAEAKAIAMLRSKQRLKALNESPPPKTEDVHSSQYDPRRITGHDSLSPTSQPRDKASTSPKSNAILPQATSSATVKAPTTTRKPSQKAESDRGIQRVLEVAAANEAAVKRLVGMMDDFDRRLRVLERQSPQTESQVYESILNGRYRLPGNC